MLDVRLIVDGRRYGGWQGIRITRTIESIANSFQIEVTDRWATQSEIIPVAEEDPCRVEVDGTVMVDGFVERRNPSLRGVERTLRFSGRDKTGVLVDSSLELRQWGFRNATALDICRKVAEPFGIEVFATASVLPLDKQSKIVVNPGDTAFEVMDKAARAAGVLLVSDGTGDVCLSRSGEGVAEALVVGENIWAIDADFDAANRFSRYQVRTQIPGKDTAFGEATRVRAESTDEGVRRTDRLLILRPASGIPAPIARKQAEWNARVRAARADSVTVQVRKWRQAGGNGALWPVNAFVDVRAPQVGINGRMLIATATFSLDSQGEVTTLNIVRPDAFDPEPPEPTGAPKVKSPAGFWKIVSGTSAKPGGGS